MEVVRIIKELREKNVALDKEIAKQLRSVKEGIKETEKHIKELDISITVFEKEVTKEFKILDQSIEELEQSFVKMERKITNLEDTFNEHTSTKKNLMDLHKRLTHIGEHQTARKILQLLMHKSILLGFSVFDLQVQCLLEDMGIPVYPATSGRFMVARIV